MQLKQLLADDDAVSPVIGVILMVAITVILAAVIGTFVLGLGDQVQTTAPNTNIAFEYTENHPDANDTLDITHDGGDGVPPEELTVVASGAQEHDGSYSDVAQTNESIFEAYDFGDTVRAGDTAELNRSDFDMSASSNKLALNESEVRVVWRGEGDRSSTLRTWSGPDA